MTDNSEPMEPFEDDRQPLNESEGLPSLVVVRADSLTIRRVAYHWDSRMPLGAVTLMPGEEGIGKSTVGVRLMADTTNGTLAGENFARPRDVLVIAPEDGVEDVFAPRLHEAGADLTRVHFVKARVSPAGDNSEVIIPRDLALLGATVQDLDVAMVWVDSLVTTLPDELKSISYKDTAKVLRALGQWAEQHRIAVVAPWHLNKASGSDTAIRIMDSRAFRTAVRSMLLVVTDPDAPEGETVGIVALDKANAGTLNVPGLRYRIRSARYVVDETDPYTGETTEKIGSCGVAEWVGEVEGDAREVARSALAPAIEKANTPRAWLRKHLTDNGETSRQDVLAAARDEEGYSLDAIKRAARALKVHSRDLTGRDPKTGRPWRSSMWSLPAQSVHTHPTAPTAPTGEDDHAPSLPIGAVQAQSVQSVQSGECHPTGNKVHPLENRPACDTCGQPLGQADAPHGQCIQCRRIEAANGRTASAS